MIPQISLKTEGLFDPARLEAWTSDQHARLRRGAVTAMREWGRDTAKVLNEEVRARMKVKRRQFPGFRAKVYAERPDRMPAIMISSKIPWLGIHGRGGTVTAKGGRGLLIPLIEHRLGPKAFLRVIQTLLRTGAGFFKEVNGRVILFAEYQREYGRPLDRFRRAERKRRGAEAPKRWAGESIPIAVLVPSVQIRKRFDLEFLVRRRLPDLVRRIEDHIARR